MKKKTFKSKRTLGENLIFAIIMIPVILVVIVLIAKGVIWLNSS